MFSYFSDHEQKVLGIVIAVLLIGCLIPIVLGWVHRSEHSLMPSLAQSKSYQFLDLNTATRQELEKLPGIGPLLSQRIIEYRQMHGGFTALEELRKIKGLTNKVYRQIYFRVSL